MAGASSVQPAGTPRGRAVAVLATVLVAALGVAYLAEAVPEWLSVNMFGVDFRIVESAADRWLHGGGFYLPYQLAGTYVHGEHLGTDSPILYPPTLLLLLFPFTVLPAALWWFVPMTVTAWVVSSHRPRPLVWPVLMYLLVFPMSLWEIATGNPLMWFTMALALGTRFGWPAALVILKPTLAPFARVGVHRRTWWMAMGVVAALSLLFLPMWPDYLRVATNMESGRGVLFSLNQFPMMMIPLIAWLGRRPLT